MIKDLSFQIQQPRETLIEKEAGRPILYCYMNDGAVSAIILVKFSEWEGMIL